jgi:superoxide dismutase, Cu-Zn family
MTRTTIAAGAAALVLAGCGPRVQGGGSEMVTLRDADGRTVGSALLAPATGGVRVVVQVAGLAPGAHGAHVHRDGVCTPPDFASAGPHFDPGGREHGTENPRGPHAGDLPNLVVQPDGRGVLSTIARGVTLTPGRENSLRKPGGTALVIHAGPDDQRTDPAGNSGARIVCGAIPEG